MSHATEDLQSFCSEMCERLSTEVRPLVRFESDVAVEANATVCGIADTAGGRVRAGSLRAACLLTGITEGPRRGAWRHGGVFHRVGRYLRLTMLCRAGRAWKAELGTAIYGGEYS